MFQLGVGPTWNGDTMTDKDTSQGDESEDDDWMSYANAGFGTTDYSLWDDGGQEAEFVVEPDWDEEDLQLVEHLLVKNREKCFKSVRCQVVPFQLKMEI